MSPSLRAWLQLVLILALSNSAASPQSPPVQPTIALPPELARVLTDYEAAWQLKDAVTLARLFTEEGFVLSSGAPMVRGRKAIQIFYGGSGGPLALRAVTYATEGKLGYIIGAFARHPGEPDVGKFTLILTKDDAGRWLIMSDMDNGNK